MLRLHGTIYLDEDDIKRIHQVQLERFGGLDGLRNPDALSIAVGQPASGFGDYESYPDIFAKAAVLAYGISESQPFVDGNKRTALHAAVVFLSVNSHEMPYADPRLYDAMMAVSNKKMTKEELADLLRELACDFQSGNQP